MMVMIFPIPSIAYEPRGEVGDNEGTLPTKVSNNEEERVNLVVNWCRKNELSMLKCNLFSPFEVPHFLEYENDKSL